MYLFIYLKYNRKTSIIIEIYLLRTYVYYSINLIFHGSEKMTESKQLLK